MDFSQFVARLQEQGMLTEIDREVSTTYEISTLMKKLDGHPLLFSNVANHALPVVANICSTRELVAQGLGIQPRDIIRTIDHAINQPQEPEEASARYRELGSLDDLPILTYYRGDGGPYIASAVLVAHDPEYGLNASYHRMMKIDSQRLVLRILPRNFHTYLERGLKEFAICIGNPMAVLVAAAISAGIEVNELAIANAMAPTPLVEVDGHRVPTADVVMIAEMTGELHDEGPFLDLTETPDIVRQQPVARIKNIYVRPHAYFHALLPGGLEHKTLMGMPREPTIYGEVAKVCQVQDVYITPGGCSWLHGAVSIHKKHPDDGRKAIEAAFRGHRSMKHVFVVDEDIDIHDPAQIEWAMATRFQGDRDMIVVRDKGSSLDPSSDLETRETTKIGFDLTIPADRDPRDFKKVPLPMDLDADEYVKKE
ncbi:MAG: UbiD family decarboxylase [Candidatus Thermoplasmatota archaeon]|nr:UbiD family decarboxylase [Candidatus Thermoplasmatota archaeon]